MSDPTDHDEPAGTEPDAEPDAHAGDEARRQTPGAPGVGALDDDPDDPGPPEPNEPA